MLLDARCFLRLSFLTFVAVPFSLPPNWCVFFLVCCGLLLSYPLDDFLCWFPIVNYWIRFLFRDSAQEKHSFEGKKRWTILFWFNFSSWPVHAHLLMYVTTSECVRILPISFSVHRTATHQNEMKWKRHWDDSWIFADLGIVFALNFALCT